VNRGPGRCASASRAAHHGRLRTQARRLDRTHDHDVEAVFRVGRLRGHLSTTSEIDAYTAVFVEDRHHAATVNLVFLEDPHAKQFHHESSVVRLR
jgi:hypothetical protein